MAMAHRMAHGDGALLQHVSLSTYMYVLVAYSYKLLLLIST